MAKSLTAANAVITLAVTDLFPVPVQMQGFAADDVFGNEAIAAAETQMGVDGKLSGGFVHVPVKWNITLMADSNSNDFFDDWNSAAQQQSDTFTANGTVLLTSLGSLWVMTKGFLTMFPPMPDAKKLLQSRKYEITWESVIKAPA